MRAGHSLGVASDPAVAAPALPRAVAAHLPFFYGWIVLGCLCCAGFARQSPAVATFSIFIEPLSREFGWSRTALSGAAALGGVLAAFAAPPLGRWLDRRGSRLVLCLAVLVVAGTMMGLSLVASLPLFYLLFCTARMMWAGPFELGIYGAVNNWFIARRPFASSIVTFAQAVGLIAMPLIAQFAILHHGWRAGWLAIGATTLIVGFIPCWLFLVRRPEDLGLLPDRAPAPTAAGTPAPAAETEFTRAQALRTPAFWLLLLYTVLIYPVQAGVSLHQAAHLIERGIDPTVAATIVSFFSLSSALATIAYGLLPRHVPIRFPMAVMALAMLAGIVVMAQLGAAAAGYVAAGLFGFGIGGILTLLPIAWADYFGRGNFGAIRGIALSAQVVAQAAGPVLSGALHDWTGTYLASLEVFAVLSLLSAVAALLARPPNPLISDRGDR